MAVVSFVLGCGSYNVRRGALAQVQGGTLAVAVTSLRDDGDDTRRQLLRRFADALGQIHHAYVEPLLGTAYPGCDFCVLTAWPDGGDLRHYLVANPTADVLAIARMIAKAVLYLHTSAPCIMHGNIDLSTILMHGQTPRLWDFALCRLDPAPTTGALVDLAPAAGNPEGMLTAMPHELYSTGLVTRASDVYAFGIVLFELFSRRRPFPSSRRLHAALLLHEGQRPARQELPAGPRADAVWAIITRCWAQNPAARPTMAQVVADLLLVA